MAKRVLLMAITPSVLQGVRQDLGLPGVELLTGSNVDDLRSALAQDDVDHIIIGGGLGLEARLEMVRQIFESSDRATIHMKDHMSGPEGFLPFVRSVLAGFSAYEPNLSPNAVLRADRT